MNLYSTGTGTRSPRSFCPYYGGPCKWEGIDAHNQPWRRGEQTAENA